jgi:predicted DNA-binding WGR domain protein
MSAIILYRTNQARNMHRFYRLDVQPDLFGEWCLMHEWDVSAAPGKLAASPSSPRQTHKPRSISSAA